jgi:zinc transporter ZupT
LQFFDLMPEALSLVVPPTYVLGCVAVGFFLYLILDRTLFNHNHHVGDGHEHPHNKGVLGAGALLVHSFLDGVAIGLAFHAGAALGVIVAVAVLVHDFSDGINTVNMVLRAGLSQTRARMWLVADAAAPMLGAASTLFFTLSSVNLGTVLALFAGFFLYIGASDLIPESNHGHPTFYTTATTVVGAFVLFLAIQLARTM